MLRNRSHKPFYALSDFYQKRFGSRVIKLPVTLADTCPNRLGLKGMKTCVFCDEWGSAAYPDQRDMDLRAQIDKKLPGLARKYHCENFLAYFQAYTNSFMAVGKLQNAFEVALSYPQIKGIIVGTRPDCLSPAVMELWKKIHETHYVSVELGAQSFFDDSLKFLERGHSAQSTKDAVVRIKETTGADVCLHLMFGVPYETDERIIQTAQEISEMTVDHVKLHNLHVLKGTALEQMYQEGTFAPIELEEYSRRVALFLQHLNPKISIQRLVALSSRWDELVAPAWTAHKMRTMQYIVDYLNTQNASQGQFYA